MAQSDVEIIEVRCPVGPRRLFAKLRSIGEEPHYTPDNLIEFACQDCRKALATQGTPAKRVLHRFDFFGTLIETVLER